MKNILITCSTALAMLASFPVLAEDPVGNWTGKIGGALRLNIYVTKSAEGQHEVTIKSPDQGNFTIKADKVEASDSLIRFSVAKLNCSYEAKWDETQKTWLGTWTQGQQAPLNLTRLDEQALAAQVKKRPQEEAIAKNTANYSSSSVSFDNDKAKIQFAGTITVPAGTGPFPAVVLVQGSGPNDRDETIFEHKIFLVLADHLSKQGIAVLRYDKRGIAASKGDYKTATSFDFADDAQAAVNYLRTRSDINQAKIGIIGHSEGGMIAPIVAARDPKVAFVVMMAGPGVKIDELMLEQLRLTGKAGGLNQTELQKAGQNNREIYTLLQSKLDGESLKAKLRTILTSADKNADTAAIDAQINGVTSPWFHAFINFDPRPYLKQVKQPLLAINGELDVQVASKMNLDGIRAATKANKHVEIKEFPKLNHLFQTAKTGSPDEYGNIEETLSPVALNAISNWILRQ